VLTILREHQRGVVFRLGRVVRVARPGVVWQIPFLDRVIVLDLNRTLLGWRGLPEREVDQCVRFIVTHYGETPVGLSPSDLLQAIEREAHRDERHRTAIELAKAVQRLRTPWYQLGKEEWSFVVDGLDFRVVNQWFGPTKLLQGGKVLAEGKAVFAISGTTPFLQAKVRTTGTTERSIAVYVMALKTVRVRVEVDGKEISDGFV
jgi:hypothetical protein